jgi:clan AA aspartic protease
MEGIVKDLQACVGVTFLLPNKPELTIEFVIDIGFAGSLTLPPDAALALGLSFQGRISAHLADGTIRDTPIYAATIEWQDGEIEVAVLAMGSRPLLGTSLLSNYRLEAEFHEGGIVLIY